MRVRIDTSVRGGLFNSILDENDCDVLSRDRDLGAILGAGLLKARPWPVASR